MLSEKEISRYSRQIVLPEIGGAGLEILRASRVLIVGAGGLGSPLALYLAAAGIGGLSILDDDRVELSNLHRQILHDEASIGEAKVESAARRLRALSGDVEITALERRLDAANARELLAGHDLVADGSDSFETRRVVHAACHALGIPLVSASVQGMEGQVTVFRAHEGPPHPCLHCLHPEIPAQGVLPTCAQGGVLGPVAGMVGTIQATLVIKELLIGCTDGGPAARRGLSGTLLLVDAGSMRIDHIRFARRPSCAFCGP